MRPTIFLLHFWIPLVEKNIAVGLESCLFLYEESERKSPKVGHHLRNPKIARIASFIALLPRTEWSSLKLPKTVSSLHHRRANE